MSQDFIWFDKDEMDLKERFYRLMDLIVTNKSSSHMETMMLYGIFYAQILCGFFDSHIGVLHMDDSSSDNYLTTLYNILRVRGLIKGNYSAFQIAIYFFFAMLLLTSIQFCFQVYNYTKNSLFTYKEFLLNFQIKVFLFALFNPLLDLLLTNICFETYNPIFPANLCAVSNNITIFLISLVMFFYSIFLSYLLNLYYNDSYFISNSFYSRMNCGYEFFMYTNSIIYSILLTQAKYLGNELFLIYNFIISLILLKFFFGKLLFYDHKTNAVAGIFHVVYVWTSLFFLVFAYLNVYEKGVIYIIGCVAVTFLFFNLRNRILENIVMDTQFHKIVNKNHIMFYLKTLIDKINTVEENLENKAVLVGLIQHHKIECPSPNCITKHKDKKIYLPITDEWSFRDKPEISDKVFLLNLVIVMFNYFISQSFYSPEMLINVSLYYLQVLGNKCQAIFYYTKVKDLKLSIEDKFSLTRLKYLISKALVEKLRPSNEVCPELVDLNVTYYYKYDDLSQKFFDEISNDVNQSLEFWKSFKIHHETGKSLDFNKILKLTDRIRITKGKVEKIWNSMFGVYSGINDLFDLYQNYIEQINDDDMMNLDLETFRNKSNNSNDTIQYNYYNLLFNKETGIIVINGSKNKEGLLERINDTVEKAFGVKSDEVKGQNVTILMPKMFEKIHNTYLQRFVETGEKKRIDKSSFISYAKDKDNCLICMKFLVKLFPMLNDEVHYCGMALKENLDDIILIDNKYNIQGMSKKLMVKFELENKDIFTSCDIPFYVICKKFLNFYKMFLKGERNNKNKKNKKLNSNIVNNTSIYSTGGVSGTIKYYESNIGQPIGSPNIISNREGDQPDYMIKDINELIGEELNASLNGGVDSANKKDEILDFNENIELEYEICIPQFLNEYVASINLKNKNNAFNLLKTNTAQSPRENEDDINNITENKSAFEENDNLIADEGGETINENPKINFIKLSEDEKDFQNKIRQLRTLFEQGKFGELDELINKYNKENPSKEITFTFTFEKYKFGDKNHAFIVRCIDTRAEFEDSYSDFTIDVNDADKIRQEKQLTAKVESLKQYLEITGEERDVLVANLNDFIHLGNDHRDFIDKLKVSRDEIASSSKVFGYKLQDIVVDDENSSQIAGTGFNDNIAKKSRIEEIRSNIMHNVSHFYTLKWIKGTFYLIIILTAVFSGLFIVITDLIYQDLVSISELNIGLYQSTIWICNIVSTLISLRSNYNFGLNKYPIHYNSYITDNQTYFQTLKTFNLDWYEDVMSKYGHIEQQINYYFENRAGSNFVSWSTNAISYPALAGGFQLHDNETFNLGFAMVLSNTNNLIKNAYFTNDPQLSNLTSFTNHTKDLITYSAFITIENAIDNLIPNMFEILSVAPNVFTNENNSNMSYVIIIILGYTFITLLLISLYGFLLYLTNKNMEEGLEKVSKIKLEKIDETIKKIESFNEKCLSKYRQTETKSPIDETNYSNETNMNNVIIMKKESYQKIFSEGQKYKRLKVLSYSYFHILIIFFLCCANLIPIYFVSQDMINYSNQILLVQDYIYGMSLTASASTVKIKCMISQCQTQNPLTFQVSIVDRSIIESTIRDLTNFPELGDFYINKYLLNACAVIYDSVNNSTRYNACMSDVLIKSANNTVSLLKLVEETVATITKSNKMKTGKPYKLINGQSVMFTSFLLYESQSLSDLEYIFYNYITPVSDSFTTVVSTSLNDYLLGIKIKIIILVLVLFVSILVLSYYIAFIFTKKLIHYLSIARVILRIIPTSVIFSTQDLEVWIENKY